MAQVIIKAITLSRYYTIETNTHNFKLSYSVDDKPKQFIVFSITDEALKSTYENEEYAQQYILQSFDSELSKSMHAEYVDCILDWVEKALLHQYADPNSWTTTTGSHNSVFLPPKNDWNETNMVTGFSAHVGEFTYAGDGAVGGKSVESLSHRLPAINKVVPRPCACCQGKSLVSSLHSTIMHLNDNARWSRERIADWVDELHDSGIIDAEFQSWEEPDKDLSLTAKANEGIEFEAQQKFSDISPLTQKVSMEFKMDTTQFDGMLQILNADLVGLEEIIKGDEDDN